MEQTCNYCDDPTYKTNGNSEAICESRAYHGRCGVGESAKKRMPAVKVITQGRNEKCNCGSGGKFKNCCIDKRI